MNSLDKEEWRWHIVVDSFGNCKEVFNSRTGAEVWVEEHDGTIIPVKEVKNDT